MKKRNPLRMKRAQSRDWIWDGDFWVAHEARVCFPSCNAYQRWKGKITFFDHLADAIQNGYHPCEECQPEIYNWETRFCHQLETLLDQSPQFYDSLPALAAHFELTPQALHGLFRRHYHRDGAKFLLEHRLKRARRLLAVQGLDPGGATLAWEASDFHENFFRATGMTVDAFAKGCSKGEFHAQLPPNLDVGHLLSYWGRDPGALDVQVGSRGIRKAVWLADEPHCLAIEFQRDAWQLQLMGPSAEEPSVVGEAYELARRMLGLDFDVYGFEARARSEPHIAALVKHQRGRTIPQTPQPIEGLIWVVVGQQVHLGFAYALRRDLIKLAGAVAPMDLIAHPRADTLASLRIDQLTKRRFSSRKAEYVVGLAQAVSSGQLPLQNLAKIGVPAATQRLLQCRGLGPWSVRYLLMRTYGFGDVVPIGDAGLVKALQHFMGLPKRPDVNQTMDAMRRFAPHRSLASFHLWGTLEQR